jgi:hypothetical protein
MNLEVAHVSKLVDAPDVNEHPWMNYFGVGGGRMK